MGSMVPEVIFDRELPHGRCVGVRIPADAEAVDELATRMLVSDEQAFASTLMPLRRQTWVGGRVAMRAALAQLGLPAFAVLPDARGAPKLPVGIVGSISHKQHVAVALVARLAQSQSGSEARVGVDVEVDVAGKVDISSNVLTPDELLELVGMEGEPRAREVLLRFSTKEAIYKALDPFVRRYVSFQEVSASPSSDGRTRITARLRSDEGPFVVDARWLRLEGLVLTSAEVSTV